MSPEIHEDWLDEALERRPAAAAPPEFTGTVMRRLAQRQSPWRHVTVRTEESFYLGLTLAFAGLCFAIDVSQVGLALGRALEAAPPVVLTAAALTTVAVWFAMRTGETA
jgi:hypothetical protein